MHPRHQYTANRLLVLALLINLVLPLLRPHAVSAAPVLSTRPRARLDSSTYEARPFAFEQLVRSVVPAIVRALPTETAPSATAGAVYTGTEADTEASLQTYLPLVIAPGHPLEGSSPSFSRAGGELRSEDGGIVLSAPPGAVSEDVWVSLRVADPPPPVDAARSTDRFFSLTARAADGRAINHFAHPLTLTVRYTPRADRPGASYGLFYYHEQQHTWLPLPIQERRPGLLVASTDHFTDFAVLTEPSSETCDPAVDSVFEAAYSAAGGYATLGCPTDSASEWGGAWAQVFANDSAIVYNSSKSAAYYIGPGYIDGYRDADGPGGFLGLPIESSIDAQPAPDYYFDYAYNFTGTPIQLFQFGFVGNTWGEWEGAYHFPLLCAVSAQVQQELIEVLPTELDPDPEDVKKTTLTVRIGGYAAPGAPAGSASFSSGTLNLIFDGSSLPPEAMTPEGDGFTFSDSYERLESEADPTFSFTANATRTGDGFMGYAPVNAAIAGERYDVPAGIGIFSLSTCSGGSLPGGGYNPPRDTTPPQIAKPTIFQDGSGNIAIETTVTDNRGVAQVIAHVDGNAHPMQVRSGDQYAVVINGLSVGKHELFITASDTSGNPARWPRSGTHIFKVEYSGVYGECKWVGYSPDPINTLIGNFIYQYLDLKLSEPGPDLEILRFYNAQSSSVGRFGLGWSTLLDMQVTAVDNPLLSGAQVRYSDGRTVNFPAAGDGFGHAPTVFDTLARDGDGYLLTRTDQTSYRFDSQGRLARVEDTSGNALELTYSGDAPAEIRASSGRSLYFTADGSGRITQLDAPEGLRLTYAYDADGRLLTVTDGNGKTVTYHYDAANGLSQLATPAGHDFVGEQQFDAQGRVVFQRVGENFINRFVYDDANRTTILSDTYGNTITYRYDDRGRLVEQIDALGGVERFGYNDDNQRTSYTDRNGNTTTYEYDAQGNKVKQTDPLGGVRTWTYDDQHHVTAETDALGRVTGYEYDPQSRRTAIVDALGGRTEMRYNDAGQLVEQISPLGARTAYAYDNGGNLIAQTDALGNTTRYEYDDRGRRVKQIDALGGVRTWAYDANGNLLAETAPLGHSTTYVYDANNSRISQTDANGNTTRYTYSKLGKLLSTTHPDGGVTTITYDDMGNRIAETDPLGHTKRWKLDALYRVIAEIDANGSATTYAYDANGNRTSVTDPRGATTRYEYDALGRVLKQIDPLGGVTSYSYDAAGNRTNETNPNGATTRYEYDALGRVLKQIDPLGGVTSSSYDAAGNRTGETDALGQITRHTYDALNREIETIDALGGVTSHSYDALGRKVATTDALGFSMRSRFDAAGRLVSATDALSGTTTFAYDAAGNQVAVTDALGFTTRTTYDSMNRAVEITDALGGITRTTYDLAGRRTATVDALGHTTSYGYDAVGRTLVVTDALGFTARSAYDAAGNLVARIDQNGATTTYEYDALNRKVRETNALGFATTFAYDPAGNLVATVDANNAATVYAYDALNRREQVTNALGFATRYQYDALGRLTRTVFADGSSTASSYDVLGRLTVETDGEGNTRRYAYDAVGNRVVSTDANGNRVNTTFDALRRPVEARDQIGLVQRSSYDAVGNAVSVTDGNGHITTFAYDGLRRRTAVTDAEANTTRSTYDAVGNIARVTDGNGHTTTYTYDARNQRVADTDPRGNITRYGYDGVSQRISATDANGVVTAYSYDAVGQLVAVVLNYRTAAPDQQTNVETRYTYDPVGNRIAITNPNGSRVAFTPDLLGQLVAEIDPLGKTIRYVYDTVGRQVERREPNGNLVWTTYDRSGRPTRTDYADGSAVERRYDGNGNLIELRDTTGTSSYSYDARNRPTGETSPRGTVAHAYDAANNEIGVTYPDGRVLRKEYFANNWLKQVTNPDGSVTSYARDGIGQVTRQASGNGTITAQEYDAANNLLRVENRQAGANGQLVVAVAYSYDAINQRTRAVYDYRNGQPRTVSETYPYDPLRRLLGMRDSDGVEVSYRYDAAGNRTAWRSNDDPQTPKPFDALDRAYSYDPADQLVRFEDRAAGASVTYGYDANGNRVERQADRDSVIYRYDGENRVVSAQEYQVNGAKKWIGHELTTMDYDGLGRRVDKTVDNQAGGGGSKTRVYAYAGLDPIASVETWNRQHLNLYRADSGRILAQDRYSGGANGQQLWLTQDGLGSTIGVAREKGQAAKNYRYDPYGIPDTREFDSDTHVAYMYTGQEYDESTGLYHFHARDYDPQTGAWLTRDPYRGSPEDPQSLHRYGYVQGNPVNLWDVLGYAAQAGTYGKDDFKLIDLINKITPGWSLLSGYSSTGSISLKIGEIVEVPKLGKLGGELWYQRSVEEGVEASLNFPELIAKPDIKIERCVSIATQLSLEVEIPLQGPLKANIYGGGGGKMGVCSYLKYDFENKTAELKLWEPKISIEIFFGAKIYVYGSLPLVVGDLYGEAGIKGEARVNFVEKELSYQIGPYALLGLEVGAGPFKAKWEYEKYWSFGGKIDF